jgi:REP element-mobilizing transposase RayT
MSGRKPNRKRDYDYTLPGYYFATICTQGRIEWFGKIADGKMELNVLGKILFHQWYWLAKQYPFIQLDAFQIMPNHVHGIIALNMDGYDERLFSVGTGLDLSLPKTPTLSLSNIIGAFKTTSSSKIHQTGFPDFSWQRSFHDRIIRNDQELERIRWYIKQNPVNWSQDRNNLHDN